MNLAIPPTAFAAHIPATSGGYSPDGGEYGVLQISVGPQRVMTSDGRPLPHPTWATKDAAVAAAQLDSRSWDSAFGVFQTGRDTYEIGMALANQSELVLTPTLASQIVFDDPTLLALVDGDVIAQRPGAVV